MNVHVLQSIQPNISLKTAYIVLFTVYIMTVLTLLRMSEMEQAATADVKLWILAAALSLLLSLVAFFLKRLIDSFDKTTHKLEEHSSHIYVILAQMKFHNEKIERIERRLDKHP